MVAERPPIPSTATFVARRSLLPSEAIHCLFSGHASPPIPSSPGGAQLSLSSSAAKLEVSVGHRVSPQISTRVGPGLERFAEHRMLKPVLLEVPCLR